MRHDQINDDIVKDRYSILNLYTPMAHLYGGVNGIYRGDLSHPSHPVNTIILSLFFLSPSIIRILLNTKYTSKT